MPTAGDAKSVPNPRYHSMPPNCIGFRHSLYGPVMTSFFVGKLCTGVPRPFLTWTINAHIIKKNAIGSESITIAYDNTEYQSMEIVHSKNLATKISKHGVRTAKNNALPITAVNL
jgi:hypothetical protein